MEAEKAVMKEEVMARVGGDGEDEVPLALVHGKKASER